MLANKSFLPGWAVCLAILGSLVPTSAFAQKDVPATSRDQALINCKANIPVAEALYGEVGHWTCYLGNPQSYFLGEDVWGNLGFWFPYFSFPAPRASCPVAKLTAITDAEALQHESERFDGLPDLSKVAADTFAGAQCILKKAAGVGARARIESAYRPQAYQDHLREVWDKWQLLINDTSEICREIKAEIRLHWERHELIRQPARTSRHSTGGAVDISAVPPNNADLYALSCSMFRPEPVKDRVHYEPKR